MFGQSFRNEELILNLQCKESVADKFIFQGYLCPVYHKSDYAVLICRTLG